MKYKYNWSQEMHLKHMVIASVNGNAFWMTTCEWVTESAY